MDTFKPIGLVIADLMKGLTVTEEDIDDAVFGKQAPLGNCEGCGQKMYDVNLESFETTGKFLCEDCTQDAFEMED